MIAPRSRHGQRDRRPSSARTRKVSHLSVLSKLSPYSSMVAPLAPLDAGTGLTRDPLAPLHDPLGPLAPRPASAPAVPALGRAPWPIAVSDLLAIAAVPSPGSRRSLQFPQRAGLAPPILLSARHQSPRSTGMPTFHPALRPHLDAWLRLGSARATPGAASSPLLVSTAAGSSTGRLPPPAARCRARCPSSSPAAAACRSLSYSRATSSSSRTPTPPAYRTTAYVGDGKFIHAADDSTGVVLTPMQSAYWAQRFAGAIRVVE